jgi:hypothetical protein
VGKLGRHNINFNDFYCLLCGKKSYTLPRKDCKRKEKFHRKKLYCLNCRCEVNHIELKSDAEVYEFKKAFEDGLFAAEALESKEWVENE